MVAAILTGFGGTVAAPTLAHTVEAGAIQVIHPWAQPAEAGDTPAFPTIANDADDGVVLLELETPVAERIEIRRQGRVVKELAIPADESVSFDSGELSLILVGVRKPLREGAIFPLSLRFSGGITIDTHMVVGQSTMMPGMIPEGRSRITISHEAIPALGWPPMTMDFALLDGVRGDYVNPGEEVYFVLAEEEEGGHAISAIRPAVFGKPPVREGEVLGAGIVEAVALE